MCVYVCFMQIIYVFNTHISTTFQIYSKFFWIVLLPGTSLFATYLCLKQKVISFPFFFFCGYGHLGNIILWFLHVARFLSSRLIYDKIISYPQITKTFLIMKYFWSSRLYGCITMACRRQFLALFFWPFSRLFIQRCLQFILYVCLFYLNVFLKDKDHKISF